MKQAKLLTIFSLLIFWSCQPEPSSDSITPIIEDIKQKYAPDKRVARFNVEYDIKAEVLRGETNLPDAKSELFKKLASLGLTPQDSIQPLPHPDLKGRHFGVVRLSVCNIRSQGKHSAELATQAVLGTPLRVHREQDGWYLIQTPDDYFGWLDADGFTLMDEKEYFNWKQRDKVVYQKDFGFSYAAPDKQAAKVSDLLAGNILGLEHVENDFAKVVFPDGRIGYILVTEVMNYDLWLASHEPNVEDILVTAHQFIGRPYLWGGTSGKGVDCSGFTKTVFYLNGVQLPRDASQQVHVGVEIETDTTLSNLLPGDLLFFGRKATAEKSERIWHVAIYLGDGQIIHSAGIVAVESLRRGEPNFVEERLNTFVRAKRILTSLGENGVTNLEESPFYAVQK